MKSRFVQLITLLSLVAGCRQDEVIPTINVTGTFNGGAWQQPDWSFKGGVFSTKGVNTKPCYLGTLDVIVTHNNPQGYEREHLYVAKIPPRVGTYRIRNLYDCDVNTDVGAQFFLTGADGDVTTAVFDVVESASNTLIVERIDSTARQLSGRLQLTLWATRRDTTTPYDTVRITDCRFTLPFIEL